MMLLRKRNQEQEEEFVMYEEQVPEVPTREVPGIQEKEDESTHKRKQLEKMAKEKPEDFAKLLRSWIAED